MSETGIPSADPGGNLEVNMSTFGEWIADHVGPPNKRIAELESENAKLREHNDAIMASFDQLAAVGCVNAHEAAEKIKLLLGQLAAGDRRLQAAGKSVDLWFGCDTPEHMADEILGLRKSITHAESMMRACLTNVNGRDSEWGERAECAIAFLRDYFDAAHEQAAKEPKNV